MRIISPISVALGGALVLSAVSTGWATDDSLPRPDSAFKGKFAAKGSKLIYEANTFDPKHEKIESAQPLPNGKVQVAFEFKEDESGTPVQNGLTGSATRDGSELRGS